MKKNLRWLFNNLDVILTIIVISIAAYFSTITSIQGNKLLYLLLALMITISLYLLIRLYRITELQKGGEQSIREMNFWLERITKSDVLNGTEDFFRRLNSLIKLNSSLDVTYFSPTPPTDMPGDEVVRYWDIHARYLSKERNFRVRRIATIQTDAKLAWLLKTIKDSGNSSNYHIAVLGIKPPFPLMNLIVVDDRHTFLFGPHRQDIQTKYMYVDDIEIARAAKKYFEDLWPRGLILKNENGIDHGVLTSIEKQLKDIST